MTIEFKATSLAETRFATTKDARTFTGYGSVFGVIDAYGDTIEKGAFDTSIETYKATKKMPFMFLNHDLYSLPIGKYTSLESDDYGLLVSGELINTTDGNNTYEALKAGVVDGLSIGFFPEKFNTNETGRNFTQVDLIEVSVVTFPANTAARIESVKSALKDGMSVRELEAFLRNRGVTRSEAIAIASQFESKTELKREADEAAIIATLNAFAVSIG